MADLQDSTERHADQLERWAPLRGRRALDIGCGGGGFMRALERRGAEAYGLETDEAQLARARALGLDAARLHVGRAEALPFDDARFDLACCIFTFHHFPPASHDRALREAARVLRPGGHLFLVEPTPSGALTEVLKPIEDETEVRTRSLAVLRTCAVPGLTRRATADYETARPFKAAEDVISMAVAVDPLRAARGADRAVRDDVEARFANLAERIDGAYLLRQPCVAFLFERDGVT